MAAVLNPPITERTIVDETHWNINSPKEVEEKGDNASPLGIYRASKTLAERAAWAFAAEHAGKARFDVVTLNPPYVYGPVIHEVDKPENLNESTRVWWETVVKGAMSDEALAEEGYVEFEPAYVLPNVDGIQLACV